MTASDPIQAFAMGSPNTLSYESDTSEERYVEHDHDVSQN